MIYSEVTQIDYGSTCGPVWPPPPTNLMPLYIGYKALMKNYVGLKGASSGQDRVVACPADAFCPNWVLAGAPPFHFVQKSLQLGIAF